MARIRTVKPEMWTDPEFVECSTNARLLFVAALNFASDYGVMLDSPTQLKMQCYPGDSIDVRPLVDELVAKRLWLRSTAPDGTNVLVIRTFCEHQRVDKPQPGRWGNWHEWPTFPERSENVPGTVDERSPCNGMEGKGMEGKGTTSSAPEISTTLAATIQTYRGATRQQEDLWGALEHELGPARTTTEKRDRGKTCKELTALDSTPIDVHGRCTEYRRRWPNVSLTDAALLKHWSGLAEGQVITGQMNHSTAALLKIAGEANRRNTS